MTDPKREILEAVLALRDIPHALLGCLLKKLGGSVAIDHEDAAGLAGYAVAVDGQNGTIYLRLVEVAPRTQTR